MRDATLEAQRRVVEAIEAHDAGVAERAMSTLIDVTAEEVGRAFSLERREDSPSPPVGESESAGA
jgi:DNA-binding FadR family transcriptional regulator